MSYLGVDLHSNSFTVCYRSSQGKERIATFEVEKIGRFRKTLRKHDELAVDDPLAKKIVKLQPTNEKGMWVDEFNKNSIFFEKDSNGNITVMKKDSVDKFKR